MSAQILDGKTIAEQIRGEVAREVEALLQGGGRAPQLTAVLLR